MKLKFKMIGKGDTKISIEVRIDTKRDVLIRSESLDLKNKLQNDIHSVLRSNGYYVNEIKISK